MDPAQRRRKKLEEARRLRDAPPERTIQAATLMSLASRRMGEASDSAAVGWALHRGRLDQHELSELAEQTGFVHAVRDLLTEVDELLAEELS